MTCPELVQVISAGMFFALLAWIIWLAYKAGGEK